MKKFLKIFFVILIVTILLGGIGYFIVPKLLNKTVIEKEFKKFLSSDLYTVKLYNLETFEEAKEVVRGKEVTMYENEGCDFSACVTPEEKLATIEAFEDKRNADSITAAENARVNEELNASSLASIAASLEYQNMMTLDDVEEV